LVRLLSTPVEGERLGAVYGIERILLAAGLSFHDLAKAIHNSPLVVDPAGRDANSWIEAGHKILKAGGLNEREEKFVADMIKRFSDKAWFEPTEKQVNWFVSLYKRQMVGYACTQSTAPTGQSATCGLSRVGLAWLQIVCRGEVE
jgi:hypothetical protein